MEYGELARVYEEVASTSLRLKKTVLIAEFLKEVPEKLRADVVLLLQGRVFAQWDRRVLGLSEKLVVKALSIAGGVGEVEVMNHWRTIGDLGEVAHKVMEHKKQSMLFAQDLSIEHVCEVLRKVASSDGKGSVDIKTKLITQLLLSSRGFEAKYLVRTVIGDLRVGIAQGTLRDALRIGLFARSFSYDEEKNVLDWDGPDGLVEALGSALDKTNDFGLVASLASSDKEEGVRRLREVRIVAGTPLKVMLAQKVLIVDEGFARVGVPCAVEYKYDGFRLQIHKVNNTVSLFTRRLENVTEQFPDVVEAVIGGVKGESFILDAEAVGFDPVSGKYRAFQDVSQRIRRKYDIESLSKKLPVETVVFDVLSFEGEDYVHASFRERRALIERIITGQERVIRVSEMLVTDDVNKATHFYEDSLRAGNEGVMLKKLDAPYQPGSRVGTMIKLKPSLDTFDLVVVGAEWGVGKRRGWLTSFTLACRDEHSGELLTIGRFGTGVKEKEESIGDTGITFDRLTELLKPHVVSENGREVVVDPQVVVEVMFEEVQASPTYTSGYALRFPRFVSLREDRGADDIASLSVVEEAYRSQRGRA